MSRRLWPGEFTRDLKFAIRQLRRSPTFTLVAVLTIALGIGANSAIFALVDATLLRPLPLPEPDRLVAISERDAASRPDSVSPLNLLDWAERSRTLETVSGFIPGVGGMVMAGRDGTAETVPRQWVLAGIFEALGVKPVIGRTLRASDDTSRSRVIVLNETFWRTRFDADPAIVDRDIRLDGESYTVVGVVPKEAELIGRASIWALTPIRGAPPQARGLRFFEAIGRLKPGITLEAARADMATVAAGLARDFPATNAGRGVLIDPLHDAVIGSDLRLTTLLFLGVVGLLLLICCANVANLLLTRSTERIREMAIRSSVGAGRRQLARQLLTEGLVLSIAGGIVGAGAGMAILRGALLLVPTGLLNDAVTPTFDLRVAVFCGATTLVIGLLFGLAPALRTTGLSAEQMMASGSRTATARRGRLRSALIVGEIATAAVLLVGAGLLLRTLLAVGSVDRGYRAGSVLTMMIDPLGSRYPDAASLVQFFDAIEGEIRSVPGVRSVAWASTLPLGRSDAGQRSVEIVGDPPLDQSQRRSADYQIVSAAYFQTVDLPIVTGRAFTDRDTRDSPAVCVVNEAFVRRHLQGRQPIGLRIALRSGGSPDDGATIREIVGVARQVKGRPDETEDFVQVYVPLLQNLTDDIYLLVRPVSGPAETLARPVRMAIASVDKEQLVSVRDVMTLEDIARAATSRHRFRATLVMTFAGLALLLAVIGVYGVVAFTVQRRTRDLAVRRALGATTGSVLRLVAGAAGRMITAGVVVGLMLSVMLSRLLTGVLVGVQPLDALTFVSVALVLGLTASVATAVPAWRATRIDPAVTLRTE